MARLLGAGDLQAIARYYAHLEDADELAESSRAFAQHPDLVFAVLRQPGLDDFDVGRLCSRYHLHLLPQMRKGGILDDPEPLLEAIHQSLFAAVRNTPALARDTDHWLVHCRSLGEFCETTGELVRARDWYKQAVATAEARVGDAPGAEPNVRVLVPLLEKLGEQYAALGEPTRALEQYALALSHRERLGERDVWPGLARIGDYCRALGRPTQALTYYQRLVTARTRRLEEAPADTENALGLATARRTVGELLWAAGNVSQALDAFERAQAAAEGLYQQLPDDGACGRELVTCLWRLGDAAWALDDLNQAVLHLERSVESGELLANRHAGQAENARLLLRSLNWLGELHKSIAEPELALASWKRALVVAEDLVERNPHNLDDMRELCYCLSRLGQLCEFLEKGTLSVHYSRRGWCLWDTHLAPGARNQYLRDLETAYYDPAQFAVPAENVGEAQAYWRKCHETLRTLANKGKHLDDEAQKSTRPFGPSGANAFTGQDSEVGRVGLRRRADVVDRARASGAFGSEVEGQCRGRAAGWYGMGRQSHRARSLDGRVSAGHSYGRRLDPPRPRRGTPRFIGRLDLGEASSGDRMSLALHLARDDVQQPDMAFAGRFVWSI
jgi:tetratricopeptide (TPR) repeat protein